MYKEMCGKWIIGVGCKLVNIKKEWEKKNKKRKKRKKK